MDMTDIVKTFLVPGVALLVGYLFKLHGDLSKRIKDIENTSITEEGVRALIADKNEVLHLADREQQGRLDRLELYMSRIDDKLGRIIDNLMSPKE